MRPFQNVTSAEISNILLQFDQPAQITLTVKTDMEGKVTAGGVDFKKMGLGFLANAVAKTSAGVPSFAAYLGATGEVSAAPVAAIPQTSRDVWQVYVVGKDGGITTHNLQVDNIQSRDLTDEAESYRKQNKLAPENLGYWKKYNDVFKITIENMFAYHESDYDYSDFGHIASENDFLEDYIKHAENDATYKIKHQPTHFLIAGLHNIVCPGYPDYPKYDPLQIKPDNSQIPHASELSNSFDAVKYFSLKQWLFDFFTENMVWEPSAGKEEPQFTVTDKQKPQNVLAGKTDIWRSHQLQFRRYLERTYAEPKPPSDDPKRPLLTVACQSKLTLSTQIVVSFDINSGVSREIAPVYVIPMSLLTADVNPAWTQTLQIQFVLANDQNNDLCEKLLQIKPLGAS